MQDLDNEILSGFNRLLTMVNEAHNAYALASEKEKNPAVKNSFLKYCKERENYINDLKQIIYENNGNVAEAFAPGEINSRNWNEIGAVAGEDNQELVVNACINGEKGIIKMYEKMLADKKIHGRAREVLMEQLSGSEYAIRKMTAHLTPISNTA